MQAESEVAGKKSPRCLPDVIEVEVGTSIFKKYIVYVFKPPFEH